MANVNLNSMANLFAKSVFTGSVINANDLQADLKAVVIDRAKRALCSVFPEEIIKENVEGTGTLSIVRGRIIFTVEDTFQIGIGEKDGEKSVCIMSAKENVWRKLDADADVMQEAAYYSMAEKSAYKALSRDFQTLSVGDFILATNTGSKEQTLLDYLRWFAKDLEDGDFNLPCVCRIERIDEISDEDLDAYDFMSNKPEGFDGGSFSEDVPEDWNGYDFSPLTYAQRRSFIQHVCILRTPTRWVAVDPQGYNYSRYVHLPFFWQDMFAADVEKAAAKEREYQAYLQAQQDERDKAQQERYDERTERIMKATNNLKGIKPYDWDKRGAQARANNAVKRILKACFPGTEFSVTKSWEWHSVEVEWAGGPTSSEVSEIMEALQGDKWDTGEVDYSDYGSRIMEHRQNQVTEVIGKISYYRAYQRTA